MNKGKDFRSFIQDQLAIAKINAEYRESFTDREGLQLFSKAFTHPTFNNEDNYEELEYIGDGVVKAILSQYLPRRFPNIARKLRSIPKFNTKTPQGILSKLRRYLEQRRTLSDIADNLGFEPYVLADENTSSTKKNQTLEDVYEAFVGALVEIVDTRIKRGLGYNYAYNYLAASLDNLDIKPTKKTLDDPITLLNELYKASNLVNNKPPLKWGDAVFNDTGLKLEKRNFAPKQPALGDIYFSTTKRLPLVFTNKGWVNTNKAPLSLKFKIPDFELVYSKENPNKPINTQLIWYVEVYGFPKDLGKTLNIKINKKELLKNPETYKAAVLGRATSFTVKEAKKFAANQALDYLAKRGYDTIDYYPMIFN